MLAGIIRCSVCRLTLRCHSTHSKGQWRYYRHTAKERGYECSAPGKYVKADEIEPQWSEIVKAIQLPDDWRQRIEELASDADERQAILKERTTIQEKLKRLKTLYEDLMIGHEEYKVKRKQLQDRLATLVLPNSPQLIEAGEYLEGLKPLWEVASLAEQREITLMLLSEMYVDVVTSRIVSIKPKPAFHFLFTEVCSNIGIVIE